MDFFQAQDRARHKTGLLVVYFLVACALMIVALYAIVVAALEYIGQKSHDQPIDLIQPQIFLLVAGGTLLVIVTGSLYKIAELRGGGAKVAVMLGGRRINPTTTDAAERQLLNVVEEMAIASGVAVPPVYLLDKEKSINAFAAGFTPDDAVIGVSRGTLDFLTRDELQGVIAHEFSHILNGDMRFNLRLVGILHGILLVAIIGYYVLRVGAVSGRSSGNRKGGGGQIALIGLGALVIGSIGLFFGRMIKAAVSRQREYLADASAVQFTRNPGGIAGALKKIGGLTSHSYIKSPEAETASHMFFGSAFRRWAHSPFATHPPLVHRVQCIDSSFEGKFAQVKPIKKRPPRAKKPVEAKAAASFPLGTPMRGLGLGEKFPLDPAVVIAAIGAPTTDHVDVSKQLLEALPPALAEAVHEMFSARAVIFSLLLDEDQQVRGKQLHIVETREGKPTRNESVRLASQLADLDRHARLPLIELIQGTLRDLSPEQYDRFRGTVIELAEADRRISLFEFVLNRLLLTHLDRVFGRAKPPIVKHFNISAVFSETVVLLSTLAQLGHADRDEASRVFELSIATLKSGRHAEIMEKKECSLKSFGTALDKLAASCPPLKKRVLTAAAYCVLADQRVTVVEAELLRTIASSLDCPMPPIVAGELATMVSPR